MTGGGVRRIPLGRTGEYEAIVSAEDYEYLTQWRWTFKRSLWKYGQRVYARRCGQIGKGRIGRTKITILMHDVVMKRKGEPRPSEAHTADHGDKDSLNNTRGNLAWATKSGQNKNQRKRISGAHLAAFEVAEAYPDIPF